MDRKGRAGGFMSENQVSFPWSPFPVFSLADAWAVGASPGAPARVCFPPPGSHAVGKLGLKMECVFGFFFPREHP